MTAKAKKADLTATIAHRMEASLLPGDHAFTAGGLEHAARFVLASAMTRKPGQPVIEVESGTAESGRLMRIAIINDDMPFLVDSLAATVAANGLAIDRLVHPVLPVRRADSGALLELPEGAAGERRESFVYLETTRVDAKLRRGLVASLAQTLADVRSAVEDWPAMKALMLEDADRVGDAEGAALLRWMANGMMTQVGHVTRHREGDESARLGVSRSGSQPLIAEATFARAFEWFDRGGTRIPLVIKANRLSNVHRRVPLDLLIVPVMKDGRVAKLSVHAGIWTSAALNAPPESVPRLRGQLKALAERFGFEPTSHDGKSLLHVLTALPHDLVIGFDDDDIARVSTTMMALVDRPRPRAVLVEAPLQRHLFAFVWLPRDMISTQVRHAVMDLLKSNAGAEVLDWALEVEGSSLALLRFVLDIREGYETIDEEALDAQLQAMLRGWGEGVEGELARLLDPGRAAAIADRYAEAFPQAYRNAYGPVEAARDVLRLRDLALAETPSPEGRDARLYHHQGDPAGQMRLKVYQVDGRLPLSDAVPALENFGFRVLAETPTFLDAAGLDCKDCAAIHDFTLGLPEGTSEEGLRARAETIEQAIAAVLNNRQENDVFNRLIVESALTAQEADWMRAFYRYLRQAGISFNIYTVCSALNHAPQVTAGLIELFRARLDPQFKGHRGKAEEAAQEAIRTGLAAVGAINDDRLLRLYKGAIEAILRTNAFAPSAEDALAIKFDSALVPGLPKPLPWREIWVYSRRVEGIHLRAGPVARGGIRWSDRRDDFRTEVLGLMKAQRVKNAVIVPTGAKGGFYPKLLPNPALDRDGWAAEGQASYELYIRSLLSITDNIVEDKVVHPEGVLIRDGEDPYFVVAADKGTARFSDIANGIAEAHGFWLGDAFASGGSNGYDHKAMGITARGAWLSVQRHFLEMGMDVQKDPVRVAGCGDMSGDVFGNGMLLSKAIKLVAAFDHRHIFFDPDPDPATSWKERKRLFALPRSSWDDYDKQLISKGGGVFPRTMKRIPLSKPMQAILATDAKDMEPDQLIAAVLKAPVDLLWFGGIGTYVKAGHENNIEVGDRANDALRVDGKDIRAKVIGEGANLGCTQAGRIEFALRGGAINTDFIDNSAGVDCSDNEVNIKIALAGARRAGRLSEERRIALLGEMTDEVAAIVLEDNRLQALALSIAAAGGAEAMPAHLRVIDMLVARGELDRANQGIAEDEELCRRAGDGKGLTKPELAVLLSTTKLLLQDAIEQSALDEDPLLEPMLMEAFPGPVSGEFRTQVLEHRLRNELIATKLANRMINRLGLTHPFELTEQEGASLAHVAAAFACADRLFGLTDIWATLDSAKMPEAARLALFDRLALATRFHMADLLRSGAGTMPADELVERLAPSIAKLSRAASKLLESEAQLHSARIRDPLAELGAPDAVTARVVHLFDLDGAVGLARLAGDTGLEPEALTEAFVDLGARLGLDWAQGRAAVMAPSDPWERVLVAGLARDFQQMRLDFLRAVTATQNGKKDPMAEVAQWAESRHAAVDQFIAIIGRARDAALVTPSMLAQLAGQARNLLTR